MLRDVLRDVFGDVEVEVRKWPRPTSRFRTPSPPRRAALHSPPLFAVPSLGEPCSLPRGHTAAATPAGPGLALASPRNWRKTCRDQEATGSSLVLGSAGSVLLNFAARGHSSAAVAPASVAPPRGNLGAPPCVVQLAAERCIPAQWGRAAARGRSGGREIGGRPEALRQLRRPGREGPPPQRDGTDEAPRSRPSLYIISSILFPVERARRQRLTERTRAQTPGSDGYAGCHCRPCGSVRPARTWRSWRQGGAHRSFQGHVVAARQPPG